MNDTDQDACFVLNYKVDWTFETIKQSTVQLEMTVEKMPNIS